MNATNKVTHVMMPRPRFEQVKRSIELARDAVGLVSLHVDDRAYRELARAAAHLADATEVLKKVNDCKEER